MNATGRDSLQTRRTLAVGSAHYDYFSLAAAGLGDLARLPYALKILLENLLRLE
ncbi:MAG: aconitase family protein, partial [Stellaceae bacterium]